MSAGWADDRSTVAKVRNGPRFAAIDPPVEHVIGAAAVLPPREKPRKSLPAMIKTGGAVEPGPPVTEIGFDVADLRGVLIAWITEREQIWIRKEANQPWPLTDNWILRDGLFDNVRRERDRVSRWIAANVVERFPGNPDLPFAIAVARLINEPETLAEVLDCLLPFDPVRMRALLEAREARGAKIWRMAYRSAMAKAGEKRISRLLDILESMWRDHEHLRWRPDDVLATFAHRWRQCDGIGGFLAGQLVADYKHVEPARSAADWWEFALPGEGSERGLNRVRGRPVNASWTEQGWHNELARLHAEITPLLAERGIARLDFQDLQNCLCECDKFLRYLEAGKITGRKYKPPQAAKPLQPPKATKPRRKAKSTPESAEATAATEATIAPPPEQKPVEDSAPAVAAFAPGNEPELEDFAAKPVDPLSAEIPAFILADIARRAAASPEQKQPTGGTNEPEAKAGAPGAEAKDHDSDAGSGHEQRRYSSAGSSPHGSTGAPRGRVLTTYIYDHPDLPPPHHYLLVEKRLDAAGDRNFFQYRWENGRWQSGVKGTYAERKVPYQLSALKAALAADPNVEVQIAEGEKDADTLRRLGFVATTNPGGADHWDADLTAWLRALGVRRAVLHEDNDAAGRKRTQQIAPALSSFATVRVARYPDVPAGEDVTYWVENLGHSKEDLAARIAAAEPAGAINFADTPLSSQEWLARVLPEPDLLLGHLLSTTARAILNATTGIGKTNFVMAASGHIGAGKDFLHWRCPRPRQILYIDGEMSRQLFRERIADVVRRLGVLPAGAHFFSKEDMPGFAPLNTRDGQVALWALIDEVERRCGQKLDAICFDSIMALLLGDMKEEDAWRDTLPLVGALTARHIGQIWVHHTGHDTSHGYGTKTREWQLDTVLHLDEIENKPPDLDIAFRLSFKKARTRTPATRLDFVDTTITLSNDRWAGVLLTNVRGKMNESLTLKFYEALCAAADSGSVARMGPHPTASINEWRAQCTAWGLLDPGKAHSARTLFSRHRLKLIAANWIACSEELAWVLS